MLNKVQIIGRLGTDPESKQTTNSSVCNFSVATTDKWKDKNGEWQEKTEWHKVVAWGKTAEVCQGMLSKGVLCYLEGKVQTRSWEGQDGKKNYITEILASSVKSLTPKGDSKQSNMFESNNEPF